MGDEQFEVPCAGCGLRIEPDQIATAVMLRVRVPGRGGYVGEGPFHPECGKARLAEDAKESKNDATL